MEHCIMNAKKDEKGFSDWLRSYDVDVIDRSDTKIDFLCCFDDLLVTVDVKKLTYKDCIILELGLYHPDDTLGWLWNSPAELICFVGYNLAVFLKLKEARDWYWWNQNNYYVHNNQPTKDYRTGNVWQSSFVKIPVNDIPEHIIKVYNYEHSA